MPKSVDRSEYDVFLKLLRRARDEAGLTQVQLADRLAQTQSFVSKVERGERRLDVVELRWWCGAMSLSLSDFAARLEQELG